MRRYILEIAFIIVQNDVSVSDNQLRLSGIKTMFPSAITTTKKAKLTVKTVI